MDYRCLGISSMMLFGRDKASDDKIDKYKLGNIIVSASIDELCKNLEMPDVVILEETIEETFIFDQKVLFNPDDIKYFKNSDEEDTAFLTEDSYSMEKIHPTSQIDFSKFGLEQGEIDFSQQIILYSPRSDKTEKYQDSSENLRNHMAFTIVVCKNNKYFTGFPNRGFHVNHRISYKSESSDLELNVYMPHHPDFKQARENGFKVRELEPDLKSELKSPSDLKALINYLK